MEQTTFAPKMANVVCSADIITKHTNVFKSTLISSGVFVASADSSRLPRFCVQLLEDTKFAITLRKKEKKGQRNSRTCTSSAADIR